MRQPVQASGVSRRPGGDEEHHCQAACSFGMTLTLDHLRRYAVARSLFKPTTLPRAIQRQIRKIAHENSHL